MQILYICEYMYQRQYLFYLELFPFLPSLSSSFCLYAWQGQGIIANMLLL